MALKVNIQAFLKIMFFVLLKDCWFFKKISFFSQTQLKQLMEKLGNTVSKVNTLKKPITFYVITEVLMVSLSFTYTANDKRQIQVENLSI